MYDEEIEGEEEVEEQKPPEYEFILESDRNILSSMYPDICDSGTWYNPEYPPPTINTGLQFLSVNFRYISELPVVSQGLKFLKMI